MPKQCNDDCILNQNHNSNNNNEKKNREKIFLFTLCQLVRSTDTVRQQWRPNGYTSSTYVPKVSRVEWKKQKKREKSESFISVSWKWTAINAIDSKNEREKKEKKENSNIRHGRNRQINSKNGMLRISLYTINKRQITIDL